VHENADLAPPFRNLDAHIFPLTHPHPSATTRQPFSFFSRILQA
jgi:hypothetical protein